MTEVVIVGDPAEAGRLAADSILSTFTLVPELVLGVATGSTPRPVYQALAERVRAESTDLSRVRAFALDEYVGLPVSHPQSYRSVITREVVEPLGLTPEMVSVPNGDPDAASHAGPDYESAIHAAGGIDVQILGIGSNGHVGFNEPGSSFASLTRVKTLTETTRRDNARFFDSPEQVPMHCVTQGIGTILRAKHLVLLAFGEGKSAAVAGAVEGPVSSSCPASAIQLHPHATVIVDEAAASQLAQGDYYRWAWRNKPAWQTM
jgi:glucosamine-6-phosphate deaminase